MRLGSLFSGIGGLEMGLSRVLDISPQWFVEIEPSCQKVLKRDYPQTPIYSDINNFECRPGEVDIICGGFPCQDLSSANTKSRVGLEGDKSGLWFQFKRIVSDARPSWVVVENVPPAKNWVPTVRGNLWSLGYSSMSVQLSASSLGAPHNRTRVFVIAFPHSNSESISAIHEKVAVMQETTGFMRDWGSAPPRGYRVDDGVPNGTQRRRALGNAVMPDMAEKIGMLIHG
jgi:DNA (cytosine-5)-methyltransferase 1